MTRTTERAVSTQRVFYRRALIAAVLVIIGASIVARANEPEPGPGEARVLAAHPGVQS